MLLVYDISDYSSFEGRFGFFGFRSYLFLIQQTPTGIRKWVDELSEAGVGDSRYVPKLLIGNKTDATDRAVSAEQGRKLAEDIGAMFCETSAKYSDGVTAAFMTLAK